MKRIIITAVVFVATGLCGAAQDTVRMTLDSCLRYAWRHNLQVQGAELDRRSAEVVQKGARERFLPSVSASASQTLLTTSDMGRGGQAGVNGTLTLFSGLSNLRTLKQSNLSAEQSDLRLEQTRQGVAIQIVQAYLTMLMNEEKLAYQQEVLERSRQQQLEGEVKYRVGRILESDYLLLQANYTSAQSETDNTRLTIESNRRDIARLLCMDAVPEVVPLDDTLKASERQLPSYDSVLSQARRAMPDWQISRMDVDLAELGVKLAETSFMPTLTLGAGYGGQWIPADVADATGSSKLSDNGSLTLGLSIPVFDRGSSATQLSQSKIALQQAQLQHDQTLLDLERQMANLYIGTRQALNRYRAAEALDEAYHASYEVYVLKYSEGAVTTVEMLQQQERYLSALNDYLQNKYTFLLSEIQMDIYTGKRLTH